MTVTVVASPLFTPPRNEITVSVPSGNVMTNPVLSRIVDGVAEQVRTQPDAGFDTRTMFDYEMPYDVPCTYEFVTDYINPVGSTIWDETWANLSAWSFTNSTHSVSGGKLVFTPAGNIGSNTIARSMSAGVYRVVISSLAQTGATTGSFSSSSVRLGIGIVFILNVTADGYVSVYDPNANRRTKTTITASQPITVDMLPNTVLISGTGGTWTSARFIDNGISEIDVACYAPNGTETFTVGEIKITSYPVPTHSDELSSPVAISPLQPWLIHPSNPGLSMPLSSTDRSAVAIRSVGEVVNASAITEHQILGQSLPITTTSGPRFGAKYQLGLMSRTAVQERALMGLVADGTPLLFRAPFIYPIGIEEGFYAVGDVSRTRLADRLGDETRFFTLPLTRVQSPIVNVQNTGWSWAALAAQFATWADVAAAFATWADVFTNNRKPGY